MMEMPEWVKPGGKFRLDYGTFPATLYHVRAIVDGRAVVKNWNPVKRYWAYTVKDPDWFFYNEKGIECVS